MFSIQNHNDFRRILKAELERRCNRNARYSLRAFARDLELSPSRLSEILAGKQGLSPVRAGEIADKLGYNEGERQHFCNLVEALHSKSALKRRLAEMRLAQSQMQQNGTLAMDAYHAISDWYHFAILELVDLPEFSESPRWLARKLDIGETLAGAALERLLRMGLLVRNTKGRVTASSSYSSSPNDVPSDAIKKFHSQVFERATSALYRQPVEEREFASGMGCIDRSQLTEAKEMLRDFRKTFWSRFSTTDKKNSVYCLGLQFFRLDQDIGDAS